MKPPFILPIENMTPERFEEMCRAHDLTYSYSDDYGVWKNGDNEYKILLKAADSLGKSVSVPIWNNVVKEKIRPPHNKQYLWEQ